MKHCLPQQTPKFNFIMHNDQLVIQTYFPQDSFFYQIQLPPNPFIDFYLIEQLLQNGEYKIISKTSNILHIRFGATNLQLLSINNQKHNEHQLKNTQKIKWSNQFKSKNIKIIGNQAIKLQQKTTHSYDFVLIQIGPSKILSNQTQKWSLKYKKKQDTIGIGICLKSLVQKQQYNSEYMDWFATGHGMYMIDSDGCCYSHSYSQFNCVDKSFQFQQNDVITVEYNPVEWRLKFSLNKNDKTFEMPIQPGSIYDSYHPIVSFSQQNNTVEIVEIDN